VTLLIIDTDVVEAVVDSVKPGIEEEVTVLSNDFEAGRTVEEAVLLSVGTGVLKREVVATVLPVDDEVLKKEVDSVGAGTDKEVLMLSADLEVDEKMVVKILINVSSGVFVTEAEAVAELLGGLFAAWVLAGRTLGVGFKFLPWFGGPV
jgi:microcompartment protein CcmK/EutM